MIELNVMKLNLMAKLPEYATVGAACFDIFALCDEPVTVSAGSPVVISTGLAFEIPENHVMLVFSRSGHGFKHSTRLANCVGVIDSDYRGELKIKLHADEENHSHLDLTVMHHDRIAQGMIVPYPKVTFQEVYSLTETERASGGFGSTGA